MHSEICPVCHGEGTIPVIGMTTSTDPRKTCHACNGAGYILVPDEHPYWPEPYYPPQPFTPFYIDPQYPFYFPFYIDPQYPFYFCCMVIPSD